MSKKSTVVIAIGVVCVAVLAVFMFNQDYLNDRYIKLAKYKGLTYTKKSSKVTDKDVKERVKAELKGHATADKVKDGKVEKGNDIDIKYKALKDFKGSEAETTIAVGAGQLPGDMDDKIVGVEVGKEEKIVVKLPDNYEDEKVKGQSVIFKVKVSARTVEVLPDYDDFVKDMGYDSTADYEKDLKKTIQKEKKEQNQSDTEYELILKVVDKSKIKKYPRQLVEDYKEQFTNSYKEMAGDQDWEDFLKSELKTTPKELDKQMKNQAEYKTKVVMVVQYIAKKENIKVSKKEFEKTKKEILDNFNSTEKTFEKGYGMTIDEYCEQNETELVLLTQKVSKFIYKNAKEDK